MNVEERMDYVRYRLERSNQALQAAAANLREELLNDAVNRLYYACFYAVSALLILNGHESSKHSGVRSLFEQHFVKPGLFPRHFGRFYHQLFDSRQDGDYEDFMAFEKGIVEEWLQVSRAFIGAISEAIASAPKGTPLPTHDKSPSSE